MRRQEKNNEVDLIFAKGKEDDEESTSNDTGLKIKHRFYWHGGKFCHTP